MSLSLNEVEALAKKATRGAGYPWGLAEDAGKAVRWLYSRDVEASAALASVLRESAAYGLRDRTPRLSGTPPSLWTAAGNSLCPIVCGTALSDLAIVLDDAELSLQNVACPILLAPFAGLAAGHLDRTVSLIWGESVVTTDSRVLSVEGEISTQTATVTVTTGMPLTSPQPVRTRANVPADILALLDQFAAQTLAPATEESRLKGAGSSLSDNE
ncbi:MAG: DUF3726 domain-containing protein [Pseudomonadota bacterium]